MSKKQTYISLPVALKLSCPLPDSGRYHLLQVSIVASESELGSNEEFEGQSLANADKMKK